ncbi:MAG: sugar transferase [Planctomycetaceae bacterium]|nr:sugar transferase [Planctomycetaceae bacterium]
MPRFIRVLHFGRRDRRLAAFLNEPPSADRWLSILQQAAPCGTLSAATVTIFPPEWIQANPHLAERDGLENAEAHEADRLLLLNARYLLKADEKKLGGLIAGADAEMIGITIRLQLQGGKESLCLTEDDHIAGFRRIYEDIVEPSPPGASPHMLIIKKKCLSALDLASEWPFDGERLKDIARRRGLEMLFFNAGGRILDLESEQGLAAFMAMHAQKQGSTPAREVQTAAAKTFSSPSPLMQLRMFSQPDSTFRLRHGCSYARLGKRLFDLVVSSCILLGLLPLLLAVALLVKLTSPGPVLYGARRQGLHGRAFDCLKFRTMIVSADTFQDRLRAVNQVDGPQFKIENDPRISGIGKFLRDTCIDELPQFLNVLAGQMSVVGPRPSPVAENECCPSWRDARLSVRPGITGLWQVCRTRRNSMDFQEWVYYDTKYVKNLSFFTDLVICFKTAQKLIGNLLDQFG